MQTETRNKKPATKGTASPTALAGRLRLLQSELADDAPEVRQQLLAEEVERVLKSLAPSARLSFLKQLEEHFPTWDSQVDVSQQTAATPAIDQRELQDPSF